MKQNETSGRQSVTGSYILSSVASETCVYLLLRVSLEPHLTDPHVMLCASLFEI